MRNALRLGLIMAMVLVACAAPEVQPPAEPTSPPEPTEEPVICNGECQAPTLAAIDLIDSVGFHGMSEDLSEAAVLATVGPVVGVTAAIDVINSSGFHGMQEEIEAASSFEEISPRDLGTVQNALAASLAAPWPEGLIEAVAAFEADAQALADALTAAELEAAQEAIAGIHHTQHDLSGLAFEWLAAQTRVAGDGALAVVGVTAAIDVINSSGFHGMQEEIEAASSFEEISPRDLGTVQNALAASLAAPWPEGLIEAVTAFEADAQALADALTAAELEAAQEAVAGIHHTQHDLSGEAFAWLAGNDGDSLMASLINARYLGRVENVMAVVLATPWNDDLQDQAGRFAADLMALAEALATNDVGAAVEAGHAIHSSQHDLSHDTYEWLSEQQEVTADPAAVLAGIDIIDSAGFHGITEEIAGASSFEEISPRNLGRVQNALFAGQIVIWPGELAPYAATFLGDANALVEALNTADLEASVSAAEAIHSSQHDLSHETYHWFGEQTARASGVGAAVAAIDVIDSSGFHGMAEEIEKAGAMEEVNPRNLGTLESALAAAGLIDWPAALSDYSESFIASASSLAEALDSGDLQSAKEAAGEVHHTQHDLSNAVYAWLFEEVGGNPIAMHEQSAGHSDEHAEAELPEEYADAEVVQLEVTDWGWDPEVITLSAGVPVVLEITNTGLMPHGIWIPSLAINVATPPGRVTLVPLTPEETGEFMMGCNEPMCGTAEQHAEMFTTIVVE